MPRRKRKEFLGSSECYRLMKRLNLSLKEAVGTYTLLVSYIARDHPDGFLQDVPDQEIADFCDWPGEPNVLIEALIDAQSLARHDNCLMITAWLDRVPDAARGRARNARRDETPSKKHQAKLPFTEAPHAPAVARTVVPHAAPIVSQESAQKSAVLESVCAAVTCASGTPHALSESESDSVSVTSDSDSECAGRSSVSASEDGHRGVRNTTFESMVQTLRVPYRERLSTSPLGKQVRADVTSLMRLIANTIRSPDVDIARRESLVLIAIAKEAAISCGQRAPMAKLMFLAKQKGLYQSGAMTAR